MVVAGRVVRSDEVAAPVRVAEAEDAAALHVGLGDVLVPAAAVGHVVDLRAAEAFAPVPAAVVGDAVVLPVVVEDAPVLAVAADA